MHQLIMYIFIKMLEDSNLEEVMGEPEDAGIATDSHSQD